MTQLKQLAVVIVAVATLAGCSNKQEAMRAASVGAEMEMDMKAIAASAPMERRPDSTLAYEHTVQIETPKELLAARVVAVRDACNADKQNGCTLLEISNRTIDDVPHGSVRLRVAPGGVDTLIKLASQDGEVIDSRTHAEDLAQPLADTERQLALLNLHRQRLMEFMARKDIGVEQLITVSRELATVQAQLEEFGSQRANLRRRVDTELVTLSWSAPVTAYQSAQTPIADALRSFGANFREAISQVIVFLAYVLPWLVIIAPGLMLVRWLWRRTSAWLGRRRSVNAAST
jgi:hypothetical protein